MLKMQQEGRFGHFYTKLRDTRLSFSPKSGDQLEDNGRLMVSDNTATRRSNCRTPTPVQQARQQVKQGEMWPIDREETLNAMDRCVKNKRPLNAVY